jgi:hypothetical protein
MQVDQVRMAPWFIAAVEVPEHALVLKVPSRPNSRPGEIEIAN